MKRIQITLCLLLAITAATPTSAQVSAFTYQGRLDLNGAPANGHYDFMFRLLNDATNGVAAPVIPIALAVPVSNGLFTTGMDFGAENFDGANRWLEINVRTNGGGPFTTLSPRQVLTPTPYAIAAQTASNLLGALPAGQISGTILNASLPASPTFSGTVMASSFAGNGANLTDVNAARLGGISGSEFWKTTGNTGTTAGTHFLGTTDNEPFEIKVNGKRTVRFEPGGNASPNIIGGAQFNHVASGVVGATISGGGATNAFGLPFSNSVAGNFGTIGGGIGNSIGAEAGWNAPYSTIAGGQANAILSSQHGTISGGSFNTLATNGYGVIAGGTLNAIGWAANYSVIGGGYMNTVEFARDFASVGGGCKNTAIGIGTTIGGGFQNVASGYGATVAGGGYIPDLGNTAAGEFSSIGGGRGNTAAGYSSAIAGGEQNTNSGAFASVGGGSGNMIHSNAISATIGGGEANTIQSNSPSSVIGGGKANVILADADFATIAGGQLNISSGPWSTVGGGFNNRASGGSSTVAGGASNSSDAGSATVACGFGNVSRGYASTVAGGDLNVSGGYTSFVGGGERNMSTGHWATVSGGSHNICSANYATVAGGSQNTAGGQGSFAAGFGATAQHDGALIFADFTKLYFNSTTTNEFAVRATGGVRFVSGIDTNGAPAAGVSLAPGSGSWTSMSDRNAKANFRAAYAREVLEKVVTLPVQTWNYKSQDASTRHIGPMAQDFKAAFGVGESDTGISTVDADGVALAAIQGLNEKVEVSGQKSAARIQKLEAENAELKARLAELERAIQKLGILETEP